MKNRRQYDKKFKQMAVELSRNHDNFRELAKELDNGTDQEYLFKKQKNLWQPQEEENLPRHTKCNTTLNYH